MNDITKQLVQAVCENNIQQAKSTVKVILANDTAQKDHYFRQRMQNKLNTQSLNLIELPQDLHGLLIYEDVSVSFNEDRYYISEREKVLFQQIIDMRNASEKLSEMGISFLNSTLFYGESGTGKTTFGRYIAYKMGIPFAYLNFSNVVSSYLGSTQKNISKVFDYIRKSECVFMIDEIDAIGLRRGKEDVGEMARIVICLMQNLDMLPNNVVLIGATNRFDMIDEALLRRFTTKHEIKRFGQQERYEMIRKFLDDIGTSYTDKTVIGYSLNENTQAQIMNDVVIALAKSIQSNSILELVN